MQPHLTVANARRYAIANSLFAPATLQGAIDRLGFVQADPIRAPARAQDLILRHRVDEYLAGDLERQYSSLDIEEDYLYAYGFVARRVWNLLHPRSHTRMRAFEHKVLDVVRALGEAHPAALEAHLGRRRVINAWGGYSKATTQALEELHYRGLVRIVRRERGIRIYKPSSPPGESTPSPDRLRGLIMVNAAIFAPAPLKTLQAVVARYSALGKPRNAIAELVKSGQLRQDAIDSTSYVWPADAPMDGDVPRKVRFLAPFDPLVWDRARFEHFWRWQYRFEAYTPVKKRVRGYYALPMLWGDDIVGWANVTGGTALSVDLGFVTRRPRERDFGRELDAEIAKLERFLGTSIANGRSP
jgi:uncharacterized protein YcaQ